jgi:hypothetical protein
LGFLLLAEAKAAESLTKGTLSFVLDYIHTQWIICTLPAPTLPISSMDNYFLPIPSLFEMGVDLNMDSE